MINLSLKYRIAIIIFVLEAIMLAIVLQQTLGQSYDASNKLISSHQLAIANLIDGISKNALLTEEYAEQQPYIEDLVKTTKITHISITDRKNNIVMSTNPSLIGKPIPSFDVDINKSINQVDIKSGEQTLGILTIIFSTDELASAYNNARNFGISIALTGMAIIAAVGVLVGFLLTRRLDAITVAARKLAEGDYNSRTNIKSQDELGRLGSAFDNMAHRLLENKKDLDETISMLKKKEQDISITLNSIGDAVIVTDNNGYVTHMNPVAEKLTGWPLSDAIKKPLQTIFPVINTDNRKPLNSLVEMVIATGEAIYLNEQATLIARDGSEHHISDSIAPIRYTNEKTILGTVLVFSDVTEQFRLRELASKSKRDLQAIMDHSPAAILVVDTNGNLRYSNKRHKELYNYGDKSVEGKNLTDILPNDIAETVVNKNIAVIMAKRTVTYDDVIEVNGEKQTYNTIIFPLYDSDNQAYAVCSISSDITDRVQTEEALRRSQKMDAIGQLSGGIAHDFNNQLGIIIGYLDFLEAYTQDNKKAHNWVEIATRATTRCMDLTRQLLSFARTGGGATTNLQVNKLISELKAIFERTVTPAISIEYELENDIWNCIAEPGEFQDAILNIIINARDAMPNGGKICIVTSNTTLHDNEVNNMNIDPGEYIKISISDTGTGMDTNIIDRLFEPFFSTKPKNQGTGLGMSMVYGFISRNHGDIQVSSAPGKGTTIAMLLPRMTQQSTGVKEPEAVDNKDLPRGEESVLIVDDELELLDLAAEYLNSLGYTTYKASNAPEAFNVLSRNEDIAIVFSDIIMPGGMNGYDLAKVVTEIRPDVKILLTTGYASKVPENAEKDLVYLRKPYRKSTLAIQIREVLDR